MWYNYDMNSTATIKPWGSFVSFTNNEVSTVKLLYITKGEEFSLQYHLNRDEFWRVIKGSPKIIIGEKTLDSHEGEEFFVPAGTNHRVGAPVDDVVILEISKGVFDENDIVRLEDKYNRI
ncbi:MAG: mannose-6-phosphate isomerase [Patescibacteria group bacterium]|jgi:mannose-1-phosphate guanylyltransferase/mannose-1-phosphate guanylyltransferase/mannose-6-phosphate isomerase|nr:mannose-6-phosphate isomerase [Patescibacteria group bacterium]